MINPKNIHDLTSDELNSLIRMLESPDAAGVLFPVIAAEQERLIAQLIQENDEQVRGRVKQCGWFPSILPLAYERLDEMRKEAERAADSEKIASRRK